MKVGISSVEGEVPAFFIDTTQSSIKKTVKTKGITPLYLVTDHTGFYERYGWEFLCMVQGDGEPDMTRMYIHR
jgi:hypothetical protein